MKLSAKQKAYLRLAGRALIAGVVAALIFPHNADGTMAWKAAAVAGVLAFCEVFTPLNSLVGLFKKGSAS